MNLKIPYVIFEEHNEAFYYWGQAAEKGFLAPKNNILFHVDHHDDMECGGYHWDFRRAFSSLEERREFTYQELGIADFIVPAFYEGLFDQLYMMKSLLPKPFQEEQRLVRLTGTNTLSVLRYVPFLHSKYKNSADPDYRFFTYHEGSLMDTPALKNIVLDVDLDYFCWDDSLHTTEPKRMELTKQAFEEYQANPYHPFRILPRKLLNAVEEGGHYYLEYKEPLEPGDIASEDLIQKRMDRFFQWLKQQPWEPCFMTICRSAHSGYLPRTRAAFVEEQFLHGLQDIWGERAGLWAAFLHSKTFHQIFYK